MEKFERMKWDSKYTVHVKNLDDQHKKLFEIANKLIDKYESGDTRCYEAINELVNYLWEHFRAEQRLMMELNYPAFAIHMEQHKNFMNKVEGFLRDCRSGRENLTADMLSFLVNWVFSHTTSLDLKYGEYLFRSRNKAGKK